MPAPINAFSMQDPTVPTPPSAEQWLVLHLAAIHRWFSKDELKAFIGRL
jgi:hypothetical protein